MITLGEFLSDRLVRLILHLSFAITAAVFLYATGTQLGVLKILSLVWCMLFFTVNFRDYYKCRAYLEELNAIMDRLEKKQLFAECVPVPRSVYERKLFILFRMSGKAMIEAVSDAEAAQQQYREYVESWVHEIKTPITAAQLICQSADAETRRKLAHELARIENHVERALFYARAESAEKDFIVCQSNLYELATLAVQRHRTLLIQSGVCVELQDLKETVYTDGKWVVFMLGQLLQNAVRYRGENPAITLTARRLGQQVQLSVKDNGIGIPSHELSRVFDRGFTGSNGRIRGGSTGMGLYLCRKLAASLEIKLQVKSGEGKGTTVILTFPASIKLSKM